MGLDVTKSVVGEFLDGLSLRGTWFCGHTSFDPRIVTGFLRCSAVLFLLQNLSKAKLLTAPEWIYRSIRRCCEYADIQNVRNGQTSFSLMPIDEGP
jgi:hypothetical protein